MSRYSLRVDKDIAVPKQGILVGFLDAVSIEIEGIDEKDENLPVSALFLYYPIDNACYNYATAYMDNPTKIRIVTNVPIDSVAET